MTDRKKVCSIDGNKNQKVDLLSITNEFKEVFAIEGSGHFRVEGQIVDEATIEGAMAIVQCLKRWHRCMMNLPESDATLETLDAAIAKAKEQLKGGV